MGTTEKVANFIVGLDFGDIPPLGIKRAKTSILDTIGTALAGSTGPIGTIITDLVTESGGNPQARLIGKGIKTSTLNAALANGAFAHADDYDDMGSLGHPGSVLTPIGLALGEELKLSGKKIIEAYAVGWEIGNRLRISMGSIQYEKGLHMTGYFGTVGAAAEAAKLLELDATKTRIALGIAAAQAFGILQNFGTYTKPLHAGSAARAGILAAKLAKKGYTADLDVLEGPRGFFNAFAHEDGSIGRMTEKLGEPLEIGAEGGWFAIKPWPCCGSNHLPLTAILNLVNQHNVKPNEVNSIEVTTMYKPPGTLIRTNPQCGYNGHFSLQYNMAAAVLDRKVDLDSFSDEKFLRPEMQDLIKKVKVFQHPDWVDKPLRLRSETRFVIVTLHLKDGRVLSERRDTAKHLVGEEIYTKYRQNAKIAGIADSKIERSIKLIEKLDKLDDITELIDTVS